MLREDFAGFARDGPERVLSFHDYLKHVPMGHSIFPQISQKITLYITLLSIKQESQGFAADLS